MSYRLLVLYLFVFVVSGLEMTKSLENIENMFMKRCDNKLSKELSDQYDKCDSEASDTIKETVQKCAKENCNKDGKFDKLDVCCYTIKPNAMFACFEKTVREIESNKAKENGENLDDFHRKNSHNSAKIIECYQEIED